MRLAHNGIGLDIENIILSNLSPGDALFKEALSLFPFGKFHKGSTALLHILFKFSVSFFSHPGIFQFIMEKFMHLWYINTTHLKAQTHRLIASGFLRSLFRRNTSKTGQQSITCGVNKAFGRNFCQTIYRLYHTGVNSSILYCCSHQGSTIKDSYPGFLAPFIIKPGQALRHIESLPATVAIFIFNTQQGRNSLFLLNAPVKLQNIWGIAIMDKSPHAWIYQTLGSQSPQGNSLLHQNSAGPIFSGIDGRCRTCRTATNNANIRIIKYWQISIIEICCGSLTTKCLSL